MSIFLSVVLAASLASALFYFRWLERPAGQFRTALKTLPVALLAVYAFLSGGPLLLVTALALAALGDSCLAYEGRSPFLAGLAAFLVAHLALIALFWPSIELSLITASAWRYAAAWFFVVLTAMMLLLLWRPAGPLVAPVVFYAAAIVAMALSALAVKPILPSVGAAFFVMSDAGLAIQKFLLKRHDPVMKRLNRFIWATYYAAQSVFTLAFAGLPSF